MSGIPQWMLVEDDYIPLKDKDSFISKSLISIAGILSKLRIQDNKKGTGVNINPIVKLAVTLIAIVLISLSRGRSFAIVMDVFFLFTISLLEARQIARILKVSLFAVIFTAVFVMPSIIMGNSYNAINIILKVFGAVEIVNALSASTKWDDITAALGFFFLPDIFILVLDITLKYIGILGELTLNMLYALRKKSVGLSKQKGLSISAIIAAVFLKSKEMSEEMYGAMECRGFTGEYKHIRKYSLGIVDAAVLIVGIAIVILFIYIGR